MSPPETFVLRLTLGVVPGSWDDVEAAVAHRLDHFDHRLERHGPALELTLTVPARDMWHALLLAMAAVTTLGYAVQQIDGRSADSGSPRQPTPDTR